MASPDLRRNISKIYNKMSLGVLQIMVPQIDWQRYLSIVVGKSVGLSEPIVCICLPYLHNLVELLAVTPPRYV